jgi:hypothetical protein
MNHRLTHTLIVLFLLALSANMVHTVSFHDHGVCDICLHVQSSDDADLPVETVAAFPQPDDNPYFSFLPPELCDAQWYLQPARGPPVFS